MNLDAAYEVRAYPNEYAYLFTTRYLAEYAVRFKPSFYLFDKQPEIADSVFEFVITLVTSPEGVILPPDERILPTIAAITTDFFETHERVVIYICDDSDGKGKARKRKFDGWFWYFEDSGYRKYDRCFQENDGYSYFASIIFKVTNPVKHEIIKAFDELAEQYSNPEK